MGHWWIRECRYNEAASETACRQHLCKSYAMFFRYHLVPNVAGWSNPAESVAGGRSFFGYEATGANGEWNLSGTDWSFRDSVFDGFVAGDVGKHIVACDPNNRVNAGVYRISAFVSSSTVTLDFKGGAGEYPVQVTGLTWYKFHPTTGVPITTGDYWYVTTPRGVKFMGCLQWYSRMACSFALSLSGGWTASDRVLPRGNGTYLGWQSRSYYELNNHGFAVIEDNGDLMAFWERQPSAGRDTNINGVICSKLIGLESDLSANEQWVLMGSGPVYFNGDWTLNRDYNPLESWTQIQDTGMGFVWVDNYGDTFVRVRTSEISHKSATEGFTSDAARTINNRTGKWDTFEPAILILNESLSGYYTSGRQVFRYHGRPYGYRDCPRTIGEHAAFDYLGTRDLIHAGRGYAFPWPGLSSPDFGA